MKQITLIFLTLVLLFSCKNDDDIPLACQEVDSFEIGDSVNLSNVNAFKFSNRKLFGNHNQNLLFQKTGEFLAESDTLILVDGQSHEIIWQHNPSDFIQSGVPYIKDGVLYWERFSIHALDLNTLEQKIIADDDDIDVGNYFSVNDGHLLYNTYDFSAGLNEIELRRKSLQTNEEIVIFSDTTSEWSQSSRHLLHPIEWENEDEKYVSFLTRKGNEFPVNEYFFRTIQLSDNSILVQRPLVGYGWIDSTPLIRGENFIYGFFTGQIGIDHPIISVNGLTGDINWSILGDLGSLEQAGNDNEHLGKYLLVRTGLDIFILDADSGERIFELPKDEEGYSFLSVNPIAVLMEDNKTLFFSSNGDFYGFFLPDNCKILHIRKEEFPEKFSDFSYDFVNKQFIFEGVSKLMVFPFE